MKAEIILWLESDRNYNKGVELYLHYGKNENFKRLFPNREIRYASKLAYELSKIAGISLVDFQKSFLKINPTNNSTPAEQPTPQIIIRIKSEIGDLYRLRSQLHRQMTELGEKNTQPIKTKRAELLAEIKNISSKFDLLYNAKENFYSTGKIPSESILNINKIATITSTPEQMSGEQRVKRRANLRSSLSKDKKKLSSLPDGPKKEILEKRILKKEKEILTLTTLIDNASK